MVPTRYILYFVGVALFTGLLTRLEIASPGALKLHVFVGDGDTLGTSEFSPIEMLQPSILLICGLLLAWVVQRCPQQRPLALTFGAFAAMFLVRELDYFLDRYVADNAWYLPVAVVAALLITYTWRHQRRLRLAWERVWPSPGLTLLFAGGIIHFAFAPFVGHTALWESLLGEDYRRIIKLTVEEFIELSGYFLWLIGTLEYWVQCRAIAQREAPEPDDRRRRRRDRRRRKNRR